MTVVTIMHPEGVVSVEHYDTLEFPSILDSCCTAACLRKLDSCLTYYVKYLPVTSVNHCMLSQINTLPNFVV